MSKNTTVLLGFIVLKFILQYFAIHPVYELHRDEFLHLDQANHLAWGYASVPPVTSWISLLIQFLGNSVFWIKFFPALFGAITIWVVWQTIDVLGGKLFAKSLGAIAVLFSVLLRLNVLYQPNSLDVLIWTSFFFILIRWIQSGHKKWLYYAAIIFAIGFLNKYNVVFLLMGILPAWLLSKHRAVFLKRDFYIALLVGFLLILPNLYWQYANDFPVFAHLKELSETQLAHLSKIDFLKGQIWYFLGSIFVLIAGIIGLLRYPAFKPYRVFVLTLVFTLAIYTGFNAKSYYAIGLYPIYLAFGAVYLEKIIPRRRFWWLGTAALGIPVLFIIPFFRVALPVNSPEFIVTHAGRFQKLGMLRWEDGKEHQLPQDFADMLGWKELARKLDSISSTLSDKNKIMILCDNYGQAGAINYYSAHKTTDAVSFSADYINWINTHQPIVHLIRVVEFPAEDDELQTVGPAFEQAKLLDSIANPFAREYRTKIYLFSHPLIDINKSLHEVLIEERNKY